MLDVHRLVGFYPTTTTQLRIRVRMGAGVGITVGVRVRVKVRVRVRVAVRIKRLSVMGLNILKIRIPAAAIQNIRDGCQNQYKYNPSINIIT
jgi:hypothetical protein